LGKETLYVCNVRVPTKFGDYNGVQTLYDYQTVSSAQYLWGSSTGYVGAIPLNPETNGLSGQDLYIGQGVVYNERMPIPLRTYYWRMRGYFSINTKVIGNLVNSGYQFVSGVLKIKPEDVYIDSDWNMRIYYDSNRGGLLRSSDALLNPAYHPNESYIRSGYNYILSDDILDTIEEDDDYYDFINLWRIEADWDWNGACFNQVLADLNVTNSFTSGEYTYIDVPLWSINLNGRTDYKLCSVEEHDSNSNGMTSILTNFQFITVYGTNVSLDFTFYGMRLLRLTDISLQNYIQSLFDNSSFSTIMVSGVKDGYPNHPDELELPSISVEHMSTRYSPVQLGGDLITYNREFGMEIFGSGKGMMDDMVNLVCSGLADNTRIPIYDYNHGFDVSEEDLPIIGYIEIMDINGYPSPNRNLHKNLKHSYSIAIKANTIILDSEFDKFYIHIPVEEFIDMAGGNS
jgi:hypothetical protein